MQVYDVFNKIHDRLWAYDNELKKLNEQIQSVVNQCEQAQVAAEHRIQVEIEKFEAYRPKLNAFIGIARAHAGKLCNANAPHAIDINKLSRISIQIDNSKRCDPYAEVLFAEANAQLLMLDRQIREKRGVLQQEKLQISKQYEQQKIAALSRKKQILSEVAAFLRSDLTDKLVHQLKMNRELFLFGPPDAALQRVKFGDYVSLGEMRCRLPAPESSVPILKERLGEYYNSENQCVNLPFYFKLPQEITYYEYPERDESLVLSGLRALIINTAHYFEKFKNIIFIDPVRYNKSGLDKLMPLSEGRHSYIEKVPTTAKEVDEILDRSLAEISCANARQPLSGKMIIIHNFPQGYTSSTVDKIRQLCANAKQFALTIVITHQIDGKDSGNSVVQNIKSLASNKLLHNGNNFYVYSGKNTFEALWYTVSNYLPDTLREKILAKQDAELSNDYEKRVGFAKKISYRKGIRYLDNIPLGIDSEGNIISIDLENSNFATFICGAARSGKSTLLHSLISTVVQNTHPDDVEIWLIDFKMTEFSRYINHMPPHVRYIILDESPELVYDIIDRLTDILQKRQNMFKGKWQKLYEVPPETYMPAMLVIMDEFSIMSQIIADSVAISSENYKAKVQALLAKGAALGMHFIFASQGFTSGTNGLTDFSKKQIQQRIAMKTEYLEIKETLDLKNTSEQDQSLMEQLAVYHALLRVPVDAEGNHLVLTKVLYISDYSKQEALIDRINQSVTPVKRYDPADPATFISKRPMVIDANRYLTWKEHLPETQKKLDDYQRNFGEALMLFPGEPRRMVTTFPIEITDSYCENVLIVAPYKEKMAAASVLLSMMESAKLQGYEVAFWASKKSTVFQQIRKGCGKTGILSATDLESICEQIQTMKACILHEQGENAVFFLLGFESLIQDMSFQQVQPANVGPTVSGIVATDNDGGSLYYQPRDAGSPDLREQMKQLLGGDEAAEAVAKAARPKEERVSAEKPVVNKVYDARQDLKYILTNGPKLGYHFVMLFGTAGELDGSKIDRELFKHRLSFRDTKQNSITVLGHSDPSLPDLEDHCFRYSNGLDSCSYRPYLHKGLSWDGWTVDENGDAFFQELEEEYLL